MDDAFVERTLTELARIPSAVALGPRTLIAPDDPLLVHYVQRGLRDRFVSAGATEILELPLNQFAVRFGSGQGPCLALMAYSPTQHHNLMADPWSGIIRTPYEIGIDEPCIFGQGITQNKAHQACLIALARHFAENSTRIPGTLWLSVNNEGQSSHACSSAILDALPVSPDLLIELFNTGFEVSIGNRGRVDIYVHVRGEATHSSQPPGGGRVITGVARVVRELERLDEKVSAKRHPLLGAEQAVPYQVIFEPLAPHTLPGYGKVTVDRRLLPGSDPAETTDELRAALAAADFSGCTVEVERGVSMLPALYPDQDLHLLSALDDSIRRHLHREPEHTIYGGSFDAGGPLARGVPTVMFGVPDEGSILGDDFVRLSAVHAEAAILLSTVTQFFS